MASAAAQVPMPRDTPCTTPALLTFQVTWMLWDVIGCKVTSIGGPSGAVERQTQASTLSSIRERTFSSGNTGFRRAVPQPDSPIQPLPARPCAHAGSGTCFLRADGELLARLAAPDLVEGVHADAVHGGRVQVHDVRLVDGRGDVACRLLEIPGIWQSEVGGSAPAAHPGVCSMLR